MKIELNRRMVLGWMGLQFALPLVATVFPREMRGQSRTRKNFLAGFFPNGAHMPHGSDGNFNFSEALAPLAAHRENISILRGARNGFGGVDPHWQNCAGFLSCHPIEVKDAGVARCAKTLDQWIADARNTPLRSLEVGGLYFHRHLLNDHPGYSDEYLNRISWEASDRFRTAEPEPSKLFERLFTDESIESKARLAYLHTRNQSVLDHVHQDATRLSKRFPGEYQSSLASYMDTVRALEKELGQAKVECPGVPPKPTETFPTPDGGFKRRFELFHELLAISFACGATNVASLMYGPSVSDNISFSELLGPGNGHHGVAHHGGSAANIERLRAINQVHALLFDDLFTRLKSHGVLDDTIVLLGSDMSDGDIHWTENLPVLVGGAGPGLMLGGELGQTAHPRALSEVYVEILAALGLSSMTSFGSGECASTGDAFGLLS